MRHSCSCSAFSFSGVNRLPASVNTCTATHCAHTVCSCMHIGALFFRSRGVSLLVTHLHAPHIRFTDKRVHFVPPPQLCYGAGANRLTFPYFIGTPTWTLHHMIAERAAEWNDTKPAASQAIVTTFKEYWQLFVTLYPCPYCRHHLNEYVYLNKERDLYPVEYIFVGWQPSADNIKGEDGTRHAYHRTLLYICDTACTPAVRW